MARTRTLLQLRDEVRLRTDTENATSWLLDADLTRMINQSIAALHDLIQQGDEDTLVQSIDIVTVAGTQNYVIAIDFFTLKHVSALIDGVRYPLDRWTWAEHNELLNAYGSGASWSTHRPRYRLTQNDRIVFLPTPAAAHTVTIHYVAAPTQLSADANTFDGRAGWEEWIVLDCAIKVMQRMDMDVSQLQIEREQVWLRIKPSTKNQDRARPRRVQDVDRGGDWEW